MFGGARSINSFLIKDYSGSQPLPVVDDFGNRDSTRQQVDEYARILFENMDERYIPSDIPDLPCDVVEEVPLDTSADSLLMQGSTLHPPPYPEPNVEVPSSYNLEAEKLPTEAAASPAPKIKNKDPKAVKLHKLVAKKKKCISELKEYVAPDTINAVNNKGRTTLQIALLKGRRLSVIKFLLVNGADPNTRDKKGNTALHHAVKTVKAETVKVLLNFNADPEIKNNKGKTAASLLKKIKGKTTSVYSINKLFKDYYPGIHYEEYTKQHHFERKKREISVVETRKSKKPKRGDVLCPPSE